MNIAGLRSIGSAVLLVFLAELAAIGLNERRQSRAPRRHPTKSPRALPRTRQMHSTIHHRTCRASLARYCGASRSKT